MLALVGGLALLLGSALFLSLAFSRGWISEEMRVLAGLVAGAGLLVLGELAFDRLRGIVGYVLVAVGLAVISLSLIAATRLYDLVPVELAVLGAFAASIAAAAIAIRHDSQLVAAYGLVSVLAAPPILGAGPTFETLLFVSAALVGTTVIALFRTWTWLPALAFVLAAPQVAVYVSGKPASADQMAAVAGFWLLNLVAAGGEEARHSTNRLRTATVTLLLASAAFTLWAGFTVLSGSLEMWRGTFLIVQAVAYLALAGAFLVRNGDRHPFGLLVAATGIASLTMAAPIQLGASVVPIAWAAEAVALTAVAVVRRHPYSALVSVIMAALAVGHLVAIEYTPGTAFARATPFVGPEGIAFAFAMAAVVVAVILVPIAWIRAALGVVAGLVSLYVFPFEISGPALVGAWAALGAAGLVVYARVVARWIEPGFHEARIASLLLPKWIEKPAGSMVSGFSSTVRPAFLTVALAAGAAATIHLIAFEYPPDSIQAGLGHQIPFNGLPGLALGLLLAAILVTGVLIPSVRPRIALAALAGVLATYVFPPEMSGPTLVAAWAALAALGLVVEARIVEPRAGPALQFGLLDGPPEQAAADLLAFAARPSMLAVALLAGCAAIGHLLAIEYPPDLMQNGLGHGVPFDGLQGLAFAVVLVAILGTGLLVPAASVRAGLAALAGVLAAYVFPFELSGPALVGAWAALAVVAYGVEALVVERIAGPTFGKAKLTRPLRSAVRAVGALTGVAVLAHLLVFDYPIDRLGKVVLSSPPYAGAEGLSLAAALAALAAAGLVLGRRWFRLAMTGIALALLIYTVTFEIDLTLVAAPWGLIALAAIVVVRRVALVELLPSNARWGVEEVSERLPYAAALLGLAFLVVQSAWLAQGVDFGDYVTGERALTGTPFLDDRTYVLAILAATLLASGLVWRGAMPRALGVLAAAAPIAWLMPFEVRPGYAVAGWSALFLVGSVTVRLIPQARQIVGGASLGLAAFAGVVALAIVAPPERLLVVEWRPIPGWSLLTDAVVALTALALALAAGGWLHRAEKLSLPVLVVAGVTAVYMLSVFVVDQFQLQVGSRPLDELQKSAQVGLSVLWSVLGAAGFAVGLGAHRPPVRLFGLALLAIASLKVFLLDLAALDVSYRVLSLLALGVLLLVSAAVYSRVQQGQTGHGGRPAGP
jgi:hypothetical protein